MPGPVRTHIHEINRLKSKSSRDEQRESSQRQLRRRETGWQRHKAERGVWTDGRVLGLIEGFLKQGVMEGTELAKTEEDLPEDEPQGTPQGGVISPLLANIYLDPLDWLMAGFGFEMVRYADDMVVLCRSQEEAEAALEKLREWLSLIHI